MGDGYDVHPHAARRWCERIQHIDKPSREQVQAALPLVLAAITAARPTRRRQSNHYDKRRIFVTDKGVHLVVSAGTVITTLDPEWTVFHCPCCHCVRKRADAIKAGSSLIEHNPDRQMIHPAGEFASRPRSPKPRKKSAAEARCRARRRRRRRDDHERG